MVLPLLLWNICDLGVVALNGEDGVTQVMVYHIYRRYKISISTERGEVRVLVVGEVLSCVREPAKKTNAGE